ncbi:MAG: ABC transporter permease [Pyrobaculum sp.]
MEHVLLIAFGDFKARLGRYILTSLAIGVSVALLVALMAVSDATRAYVEQTLYKVYPADIMIYSEAINIPTSVLDSLRKTQHVETAEGIILITGTYRGQVVSIVGVPLKDVEYFAIDLREGRLPSGGGEAVVEESLAAATGSEIILKVYSGPTGEEKTLKVKVVGVMRSFLRGFVGAFRLNLVVVPLDWLQESLGTGPFVNTVLITVKDKNYVKPLYSALKETFSEAQVYTQESLLETVSQVFNALNTVFATISGAALATAAITTFAVMSITVRERLREFGLFKAMGVSTLDVLISVVLEVGIIGAAAGVGGTAAGFYGANLVKQVLINMGINFNVPIEFRLHYPVLGLVTSLLVAMAGALLPLYRVATLRPLEIIQSWR